MGKRYGTTEPIITGPKVGRNELCPCGSGKKFKKCCQNPALKAAGAVDVRPTRPRVAKEQERHPQITQITQIEAATRMKDEA